MLHRNARGPRVFAVTVLVTGVALTLIGAARYAAVALSQFTIAKYSIIAGGGTSGTATVSPASASVQVMKFSSSNAAIAFVPAAIPIQPGGSQATAPIIGAGAAGCVTITAALGTKTMSRDLIVHPSSGSSTYTMTVPDQLLIYGATYSGKVAGALYATFPVSLTSSNPAVVTVPATVQSVRGVAHFNMATKGPGCATVTAIVRSQTISKVVRVYDIGG